MNTIRYLKSRYRLCYGMPAINAGICLLLGATWAQAAQIDITGPPGSGKFGTHVTVLPNGNIVVTDPFFDSATAADVGAVHLYSPAGVHINTLTGGRVDDNVGVLPVAVLSNGNFVVSSPYWDNGAAWDAGASTWVDGALGLSGEISASNSLVGTRIKDYVGSWVIVSLWDFPDVGVVPLNNGNYVVASTSWSSDSAVDVGAVTWADGTKGITGVISATNSLVGSSANDQVGRGGGLGVTSLANGNFVVNSPNWDRGANANAGAVTWGSGVQGITGLISVANSLVGYSTSDLENAAVLRLSNGNYVVRATGWSNQGQTLGAGAVVWADGLIGRSGEVTESNSIYGTRTGDYVGTNVVELSNGHYVISSVNWSDGVTNNVGAVTWANADGTSIGAVSTSNSIVGSMANDNVGNVTALNNGNYVIASSNWDLNAQQDVGAVTWVDGSSANTGVVSTANSLVGSSPSDRVGSKVAVLANGNYLVSSINWQNASALSAGAATLLDGGQSFSGVVSAGNSLVGTKQNDQVGLKVWPLSNGNYVVHSERWGNGAARDAGAVTWGSGTTGVVGEVSAINSLVGSSPWDANYSSVIALANGNYVVRNQHWDSGPLADVGAVTWADGLEGVSGEISAVNSLIGQGAEEQLGNLELKALSDGNFTFQTPRLNVAAVGQVGAATLVHGDGPLPTEINSTNSVIGSTADAGARMSTDYDASRGHLVVGRPRSNIVSIFSLQQDAVFESGFE